MGEPHLADFAALSRIGATPRGGVDRQAGTAEHGQARRWLVDWFERHGLRPVVDRAGNLFGTVEWVPGRPYVLAGSHLDSQPAAGRFDGAYGVLAAAHAAVSLHRGVQAGALVPARVRLDVDVRSPEPDVLAKAHQQLMAEIEAIDADGEVRVSVDSASLRPPTAYPHAGVELAEAAIAATGLSTHRMLTMAGHDSVNLKDVVPTVMLFVPSRDGISHNEAECTADVDLLNGITPLAAVTEQLLTGDLGGT
jgi:acetylornithine deacetylase/succinyl-diaminopimelate desuccinylase-like protein